MKIKTLLITFSVIAIIVILYLILRNKKTTQTTGIGTFKTVKNMKNPSEAEIIEALQDIANNKSYGLEIARNVEKIFRLETAHFTSAIYKNTNAAGMIAVKNTFPYGWNFITSKLAIFKPIGIFYVASTNFHYLQFNKTDAFNIVAEIIKQRPRIGNYYSLNDTQAAAYEAKLNSITNQYI